MRASGAIKKRFGAIEKTVGVLLVGTADVVGRGRAL